uniref:Uncharacterized protein n=1 Tax=Daphnia galeata TaxID=27404 RepID=A0A8J2RGC0_9CRUS|nr:unnamed protein product [Daphnia galeata]
MNARSIPNSEVHQSLKTGGVYGGGDFGAADRSRSNKFPQHSTADNRMTSTESGSAYYNPSNTRTASFNNNQLSRHQGTTNYDSPANQKPSYGSDSKEGCSSDDKEKETKKGLFASFAGAAKAATSSVKTGEASIREYKREPLQRRGRYVANEFSQHSLRESGTFSVNSKESACASSVFNNARASSSGRFWS